LKKRAFFYLKPSHDLKIALTPENPFWQGISYQYGIGVRRNPEEAVMWYTRAAEAGNVESMLNLAYCYANGTGVREDMKAYVSWLKSAAARGSVKATSLLNMHHGRM
jgi:TPR repeat protein